MKNKWKETFDNAVGKKHTLINSMLVSAQSRPRNYWSNIGGGIKQPKDKGIVLSSILESEFDEKYYLSEKAIKYINREDRITKKMTAINGKKALCLMSQYDQSKMVHFYVLTLMKRLMSLLLNMIYQYQH